MITSTSNPRIRQLVQWQSKARERKKSDIFIAEGLKMYEEAPNAWIRETYLSEALLKKLRQDSRREEPGRFCNKLDELGYEEVSEEVFARITDTKTPQGILSVLTRPRYTLESMTGGACPLLLVLEDIQDPGNLGTIVRTGEGAGIDGIIMSKDTVDIYNPKTIRSTMGSVYRVPFLYADNLSETLALLSRKNITTYAGDLKGKEYYNTFDFRQGTAFLVGNEGNGLKEETVRRADACLRIPMEGKVESLNAAIAASLLMYEAHRQRHVK